MNLVAAFQRVNPLLGGNDRVAIEVSRALFELREILHRFQRPLRAKQPLDIDSAQRRGLDPAPVFLRTNVAYQMGRAIGMPVDVTIQTGDAPAGPFGSSILGIVELLLGKLS